MSCFVDLTLPTYKSSENFKKQQPLKIEVENKNRANELTVYPVGTINSLEGTIPNDLKVVIQLYISSRLYSKDTKKEGKQSTILSNHVIVLMLLF